MAIRRWTGPALLAIGIAVLAALALARPPGETLLTRWILTRLLAPEKALPLLGLAVAVGLVSVRARVAGLALFAMGLAVGFWAGRPALAALSALPHAAEQDFLTGPVLCLAAGLALVPGRRIRPFVLPVAGFVGGVAAALVIKVTDVSFHDPFYPRLGTLLVLWLVVGASLTVAAFRRDWMRIGAPILGSWLVAIGVLYGGATLAPRPASALPPPPQQSSAPGLTNPQRPPLFPDAGGGDDAILDWGLGGRSEP